MMDIQKKKKHYVPIIHAVLLKIDSFIFNFLRCESDFFFFFNFFFSWDFFFFHEVIFLISCQSQFPGVSGYKTDHMFLKKIINK